MGLVNILRVLTYMNSETKRFKKIYWLPIILHVSKMWLMTVQHVRENCNECDESDRCTSVM